MTNKELREKSILELEKLALDLRQKLFALRFQNYNGQLETPSNIKDTQKTIAKILTIINEKQHETIVNDIKTQVNATKLIKIAKSKNKSLQEKKG